jgi:hypothetical protein
MKLSTSVVAVKKKLRRLSSVGTELKNRGVKDIFIACVDGLKDFPEIAQPMTESQRQVLLRTPSVSVIEGMTVTVSEPGKPLQRFMVQGKLDLPDKPPKKDPSPLLNNPFKDDKPNKGPELPDYAR